MEPYPQSSEMEQFFTKFMTAILPMRWQVHPLPEIEAWDTESRSHELPLEAALDGLAYVFSRMEIVPVCGCD
mgnify:CR=1 FL=1